MEKTELLKSLGFSDAFLAEIDSYDAKVVKIKHDHVGSFKIKSIISDRNSFIFHSDQTNTYINSNIKLVQ